MKTKEELIEQLKEYKGLLNKEIIDYLNGIINLDYSAVRDDIIDVKIKEHLSELDIYKTVATYNIYNRTKKLIEDFDKEKLLLFLDCMEFDWCSAIIRNSFKSPMDVFSFYYDKNNMVDDGEFGYINLVRYPRIEDELEITSKKIDVINYEKNMFDKICSSNERYERNAKYESLKEYYNRLKKLEQDKKSSYEIEYANECIDMISNDYDLVSPKCLIIKKPGLTISQRIGNL